MARGARAAGREARAASGGRLTHLWANAAYRGLLAFAWVLFDMTVQVVTRRDGAAGFEVQPRRWVVERTFGWLARWRRLNRNYEHTPASSKWFKWRSLGSRPAGSPGRTDGGYPHSH